MSSPYIPPTTPAPKPQRPWYKMKRSWAGIVVGLVVLGSIVDGGEDTSADTEAKPQATKTITATPTPSEKSADEALKDVQDSNKAGQDELQEQIDEAEKSAEPELEPVPDVVGMSVAEAISTLHDSGRLADEESISPGNTFIIMNSNWQVCRQDPGPGASDDIRVTIYAVKMNESC